MLPPGQIANSDFAKSNGSCAGRYFSGVDIRTRQLAQTKSSAPPLTVAFPGVDQDRFAGGSDGAGAPLASNQLISLTTIRLALQSNSQPSLAYSPFCHDG